jgi:hypothetical protein
MAKEYLQVIRTRSVEGWGRDVPFYDGFEDAILNWKNAGSAPSSISLNTSIAHKGNKSMKIQTSANLGARVNPQKNFAPTEAEILKISFFLNNQYTLANATFDWFPGISTENNETLYVPWIRFDINASKVWIVKLSPDLGTTWITLKDNLQWPMGTDYWSPFVLYVNLRTKKYMKLLIDRFVFDISQYSLGEFTSPGLQPPMYAFQLTTNEAVNKVLNIDECLVDIV